MIVHRLVALAALLVSVAACSNTDTTPRSGTDPATATRADQPATEESDVTPIRLTVDNQPLSAELADNPTARAFADQLPLTLTFRDFNRVEKIAELPRPLTTEGVPDGDDPDIADIGYYAPSNNLVLYYGDVGYWTGIVRIGRFNKDDLDLIQRQPDDFEVTIQRG